MNEEYKEEDKEEDKDGEEDSEGWAERQNNIRLDSTRLDYTTLD